MKTLINQPVYYIPYVRIIKAIDSYTTTPLSIGDEYPIQLDKGTFNHNPDCITIMVHSPIACHIYDINKDKLETFVKEVVPTFKVGDIVKRGEKGSPYKVAEHCITQGKIWYRDGWSLDTGFESGVHEENLVITTAEIYNQ